MNQETNHTKSISSWITYISFLALIGGLMYCVKSCKQDSIRQNLNAGLKNAENAIDSISAEAEKDAKSVKESLDSLAVSFKSNWKALGKYITVKLADENEVSIPEYGLEMKLVNWLKNQKNKIDKTNWFNFDRILFEPGSSKLNAVSNEQLQNIAFIMKAIPSSEYIIGGYTDNQGNESENLKLSQERANTIKNALIELGIESNRLQAKGFGNTYPIADNTHEEGRALNRRVAIQISKR